MTYTDSAQVARLAGMKTLGDNTFPNTTDVAYLQETVYAYMLPFTNGAADIDNIGRSVETRIVSYAIAEIITAREEKRGAKYSLKPTQLEIGILQNKFSTTGEDQGWGHFEPGKDT